jgi:hypothetical protein
VADRVITFVLDLLVLAKWPASGLWITSRNKRIYLGRRLRDDYTDWTCCGDMYNDCLCAAASKSLAHSFMYLILTFGVFLWVVYGALKGDAPLIAANAVTVALAGGILVLKIRHSRKPPPST